MRLHEQATPELIADDHVAADRNPLSANNGVNRVQLLAEAQVPDLFEGFEIGIDAEWFASVELTSGASKNLTAPEIRRGRNAR